MAATDIAQPRLCGVCCSASSTPWKPRSIGRLGSEALLVTDHHYGQTLGLRKCSRCGFVFAEGSELDDLTGLYEQLVDTEYEQTGDVRLRQMRWLLELAVKRRPRAKTLLDIGAGTGLLVGCAQGMGLDAVGVEPSRSFVAAAWSTNSVRLHQGTFPHAALAGRRFDLICLVDVIEHVTQPVQLLRSCAEALAEGGEMLIVTPDAASLAARLLQGRWWHFRAAHVGYFDRPSLHWALRAAGLAPREFVRAKWFFRVDYLASRLCEYLPVRWLDRLARRLPLTRWLYQCSIPLNLHDSWVVFAGKR